MCLCYINSIKVLVQIVKSSVNFQTSYLTIILPRTQSFNTDNQSRPLLPQSKARVPFGLWLIATIWNVNSDMARRRLLHFVPIRCTVHPGPYGPGCRLSLQNRRS
jgi:hypothetical protein